MLKLNWSFSVDFNNFDTPKEILQKVRILKDEYKNLNPDYSGLDTETNGLHIKNCKPFLISFGFANFGTKQAIAYTLEYGCPYFNKIIKLIYEMFGKTKKLIFFNVKFDLHMLENIGVFYPLSNITDAKIYIRLAADAKSKKEGGIPETLKDFAARYISIDAKHYEKILSDERKRKKVQNTRILKENLLKYGQPPEEFRVKNEKSWTMATINAFFQDQINDVSDLPDGVRQEVQHWMDTTEDPDNYEHLNRELVKKYAKYDIVWTIEAFYIAYPVCITRKQMQTVKIEEEAILPMYKMESVGFKFNLEYALECKKKLKNYIIQRRLDLCNLAGVKIKVGQHQLIKQILNNLGIDIDKANKGTLHNALTKLNQNPNEEIIKEFIGTIEEVRTLEKWYSTYICKWINSIGNDGRVYTQFNQTGAVSGRISSDFQQFPSKPILDNKGNVLFHPRRLIQVTGNGYDSMVYIDFAAEELRVQALYTMLVDPKKEGDLNFCRAFIPLHCHTADGTKYTVDMAYKWFDKVWYQDEDNKEWEPTDLHTKTTMTAFPNEPTDTVYFKNTLRKKYGKPTNFACVYGASINTLINQFYFPADMAKALHDGFYKAYPGIKKYADYVEYTIKRQGYIENLFGRRYYNTTGHLARNYLVQGSSADFMKIKFKELDDYLTKNNYKSRLQMSIHDECVFEIWKGEEHIIKDLKAIMEQLDGSLIPILADVEITTTSWDEKKDYEL